MAHTALTFIVLESGWLLILAICVGLLLATRRWNAELPGMGFGVLSGLVALQVCISLIPVVVLILWWLRMLP